MPDSVTKTRARSPRRIADLIPDPENRRTHNARNIGMVADALRQVGAARSIVIDERNVVLAGNGVREAAAEAGITRVRVIDAAGDEVIAVRRSGLTPDQKRALALYDNRTAELAEWNVDQLQADAAAGLELTPFFTDEELGKILGAKGGRTDPDAIPPLRATSIQAGDLFELGAHRLLCGDCTKAADLERLLAGAVADVCLTDPPYGIGLKYATFDDTLATVTALAAQWLPLARAAAKVVVFSPGIKGQWLYPEPDWVLGWFYAGGMRYCPWGFNGWQPFLAYGKDPALAASQGCRPDTIHSTSTPRADDIDHPCPKPMAVWEWLLNRLTFAPRALVVDPFAGSGTGIIAAERLERRCVALELAPAYCQVIIDRWEAFTGAHARKVADARPKGHHAKHATPTTRRRPHPARRAAR